MNDVMTAPAERHPFVTAPSRTMLALSAPVLVSLIAEPITGLVDTAFVAYLGPAPLAALGVGTTVFSAVVWAFNFLGIGTQTEVARATGSGKPELARRACSLGLALALAIGGLLGVAGILAATPASVAMGARGEVLDGSVSYLTIRSLGAPAVLLMIAAFGALRGLQEMVVPLRVAVATNVLNVILDPLLIFGLGPIPALGIAGAAWATIGSQWAGALWAVWAVAARMGLSRNLELREAGRLLIVGGDLFLRTALLTFFMVVTTRAATRIGTDAGAANHAIRQVWMLAALALDAYALTAQSLVGYFLGAGRVDLARRVASVACGWSLLTGAGLAAAMLAGDSLVAQALLPAGARGAFDSVWMIAALCQPITAITFATDGVHWGTGDYRYLRNAVGTATALGTLAVYLLDEAAAQAFLHLWIVIAGWIVIRAVFGVVRIWPGIGGGPLGRQSR